MKIDTLLKTGKTLLFFPFFLFQFATLNLTDMSLNTARKVILLVFLITYIQTVFSQNDIGYWDYERATTREFVLGSEQKRCIITEELPFGTTEVVYRITLLEEGQKMVNSLASCLTAIPTPATVGSGAAINLLSSVSGDDYCKFTIFSSYENAKGYIDNGNYQTGCYIHPSAINKYASRLSLTNSPCLSGGNNYLWFGFKNTNSWTSEKIVIEVIPWVDKKASRGWTQEYKRGFIEACSGDPALSVMQNPTSYCQCVMEKLELNYRVQDLDNMLESEITSVTERYGKECLQSTGAMESIMDNERQVAADLFNQKQYFQAATKLLGVIEQGKATVLDYNNIGYYYIFTKQYSKALKYLKEGEKLDEFDLLIKGNLAHAYLFSGEIDQAKAIYTKYKLQNIDENMSWVDMVNTDFKAFREAGLPSDNFELILSLLK